MRDLIRVRSGGDVDLAPDVAPVPAPRPDCVAALGLQATPWWNPFRHLAHRNPYSWDCKASIGTHGKSHDCGGHANSRPEYMHRCSCGFRWAA